MIYSRLGAALSHHALLRSVWRVDRVQLCIPQTPEARAALLNFTSFLCSVESWKRPSSPLGLASCSHVFWSQVIVHEVTAPRACTVHNGKTCVVLCKFSNEDILNPSITPWGKQLGTSYNLPRCRKQRERHISNKTKATFRRQLKDNCLRRINTHLTHLSEHMHIHIQYKEMPPMHRLKISVTVSTFH